MEERRPQPGERYRHFKGELYQIVTVAVHSETQEELVIYQALYGDFMVYARELVQFLSEVDQEKYPDVQQKYRFEKAEQIKKAIGFEKTEDVSVKPVQKTELEQRSQLNQKKDILSETALPDRTKVLIDFLDCDSYEEKLEYLREKKKYIDDRMLNDISFALDIVIEEGELEDRIRTLENCLKTFCRYEGTRLR